MTSAATVGALRVDLGMNTALFESGIAKVEAGLEKFGMAATRAGKAAGEMTREMREEQIAAYGRAMDGLRAKFNPLYGVVRNYRETLAEIRKAHQVGAISADEMAAAISRERQAALGSIAALKGRGQAIEGVSRAATANARNLSFQLIDIGQSIPLAFQSPLYALQNLGFQIAQIGQIYMGQGGMGQALRDIIGQVGKFARYMAPAAAAVGLVAAAFAGLTYEINKTADVQVSFGDTFMATMQLAGESIAAFLAPAIGQITTWAREAWDFTIPILKGIGNAIVSTFAGAFTAVRDTWAMLPAALGDIAISTANAVIMGVESMINGAIQLINEFTAGAREALGAIGIQVGEIGSVDFGDGLGNPFSGAAGDVANGVQNAFGSAFGTDWLGGMFDAISERAQGIAKAREETDKLTDSLGKTGAAAKDVGDKLGASMKSAEDLFFGAASSITGGIAALFEDNKAFAVANAVVNTAQAITKTWAEFGGGPWALPAVIGVAASGAAQIATILSAQKGTSTAPSVGGGTASGAGVAAPASGGRQVAGTLVLNGNSFSADQFSGVAKWLTDMVNTGGADELVLAIDRRTR